MQPSPPVSSSSDVFFFGDDEIRVRILGSGFWDFEGCQLRGRLGEVVGLAVMVSGGRDSEATGAPHAAVVGNGRLAYGGGEGIKIERVSGWRHRRSRWGGSREERARIRGQRRRRSVAEGEGRWREDGQ